MMVCRQTVDVVFDRGIRNVEQAPNPDDVQANNHEAVKGAVVIRIL